jgi:uncharacterized membrane protein YfcA
MPTLLFVAVLLVLFFACLVKATLGFGEALIAMPLLTLLIGVQMASPLTALVMSTLTLVMLLRSWQQVDLRSAWRVSLAAVIGVPIGVWGLRALPAHWITLGLGIVLVLMGLFYLTRPTLRWIPGPRWGYLFGFISGVLGGAINSGGPPVIIFGTLRRMPPAEFRATLQGCFTPLNVFILLGHALAGLWTQPVLELYAWSLPVMLGTFWLGTYFQRAIPAHSFDRAVYLSLVVLGVVMVGQAVV